MEVLTGSRVAEFCSVPAGGTNAVYGFFFFWGKLGIFCDMLACRSHAPEHGKSTRTRTEFIER